MDLKECIKELVNKAAKSDSSKEAQEFAQAAQLLAKAALMLDSMVNGE